MTDNNPNPNPEPTPTTPPAPAPTPTPAPEPKKDGDDVAELKAKLAAAEADKAKLEKEKADAAEEKRLAELSAEEKSKELEKKLAEKDRESLVNRVRLSGGFTSSVFDHFTPVGQTEDEIKSSFEGFKTSLDEYQKNKAPLPAPGAPNNTPAPTGGDPKPGKYVPELVKRGLVKQPGLT